MNKLAWIGLFSVSSLVGCAAATPNEESATGSSDVVGITDIATLEQSLGLQRTTPGNPGDTAALQAGACYQALIATPSWSATYEFRRYVNGAAFWAKLGSGYNSGDQRPVMCVDMHRPDGAMSLSGVALDAVLRYDLGGFKGSDSGMQKTHLEFERGAILLSNYDVTDQERIASVQKRPHELPFENASTISGRVMSIRVNGVNVNHLFGKPSIEDNEIEGSVAQLVYRYAWHKNEETGRFSLAEDAVGAFRRTATTGGDGGASSSSWDFARGVAFLNAQWTDRGDTSGVEETLRLQKPAATPMQAPLAECVRTTAENQPPPSFGCTGI